MAIVVVGGGVVGLTTACLLRDQLNPKIDVTVIGDKFGNETTSYGAAGIFRIKTALDNDPIRFRRWIDNSFNHYYKFARSGDAYKTGALTFLMYDIFAQEPPAHSFYIPSCLDATSISSDTMAKLKFPEECKSAVCYTSVMMECRHYLHYLRDRFEAMGGQVERRRINSLSELATDFDLAVNCTGEGAGILCNDAGMTPVRGQLIRVRAPWIKHGLIFNENNAQIFPGRDLVVLGGVAKFGVFDSSISDVDTEDILRKTQRFEPSLQGATIEETWVGHRPFRKRVRLETDPRSFDLPVVHNYGHASEGVILSYGTSLEAAEMVKSILRHMEVKL